MKNLLLPLLLLFSAFTIKAQTYNLTSPDEQLKVTVNVADKLSFNASYKNTPVIENSPISLTVEGMSTLGEAPKVRKTNEIQVSNTLTSVVPNKSATIQDEYKSLTIQFKNNYKVTFRAYNQGVAYRFSTSFKKDVTIASELFDLHFPSETTSLFPKETSLISHYERNYIPVKLDTLDTEAFCSLPVLMKANNVNVLVTEADLYDYPGMFMYGKKESALKAGFPKYVTEAKPDPSAPDRNQLFTTADYIAKTSGTRDYPWRLMIISDEDKDLIESDLVYQLSRPSALAQTDWIKPGKVAWDWYNANMIKGVDFEAGLNTETYKYYIDFASKHGLEYVILDEGWTKTTTNIREWNDDINVKELIAYGKEKNVGIILWCLWGPLDSDLSVLALYESWGAKGVKVDFMQRADQYMVNFYERVAKEAAKHHLLVDYHGAFKPSGLRRAYPNVLTYEGVRGNENNKWSAYVTPEHNVTLPFIRMVAGPMDFTPGAMVNATRQNHSISFNRPVSLGTRCHQVAMYAIYESPLQMLCESPSVYYREQETTSFIARFPAVWDETRVLDAQVADYVLIARRSGDVWYIGAMTDWTARELEIDFSFLGEGQYKMEFMQDGINAARYAEDYKFAVEDVDQSTRKKIRLAPGGGFAAIVTAK